MFLIKNYMICVIKEEGEVNAVTISYNKVLQIQSIFVAGLNTAEPMALSMAVQHLCRPLYSEYLGDNKSFLDYTTF